MTFSDFETADEAEHSARVAERGEHTHHYVPVRDGRTSQGEPQYRLVCACGTPLPSGGVTRSNDERKNDAQ